MRIEDAIRVSAVELKLERQSGFVDIINYRPAAKVDYYSRHQEPVTKKDKKYIIAFSPNDFMIVYADTLKPISRNPQLQIEDFHKVMGRDDWEPL